MHERTCERARLVWLPPLIALGLVLLRDRATGVCPGRWGVSQQLAARRGVQRLHPLTAAAAASAAACSTHAAAVSVPSTTAATRPTLEPTRHATTTLASAALALGAWRRRV